jgi:hypothetical protein
MGDVIFRWQQWSSGGAVAALSFFGDWMLDSIGEEQPWCYVRKPYQSSELI